MKHHSTGPVFVRWSARAMALIAAVSLAACGGGGGSSGGGSNAAPTAAFTVNPASGTAPLTVTVDAAASTDSDGTITSYAWSFGDSANGSGVSTTHNYTSAGTFTITLTVRDDDGKTAATTRSVTVSSGPPPPNVVVSGRITYRRVPFDNTRGGGLDYSRTMSAPARNIVVDLIKASDQSVLFTVNTDANGNYRFATAPVSTDVKVRARAQTRSTVGATWNVQVKNNANSNALYVMDSNSFNTGVADITRDLEAKSGWPDFNGTSYSDPPRVAGPFAIVDSLYSAVQFVVTQGDDHSIVLPDLNVYWSPLNQSSGNFDPATGNIQTTQYRSGASGGIYVLGKENVDTDEYDEHVLTHEFQHYLQDVTSRDDTMGGSHSFGERLDMRVAFSEGYANAFSGMSLGDSLYRDSNGASQGDDGFFDLETSSVNPLGWYNESSIGALAWDLYDSTADANDGVALPYAAIASVFRNELRAGQALTSIFPLVVALKTNNAASAATINTLVGSFQIVAGTMTPFAATETNDGGNGDALPLYTNIVPNGPAVAVCGNDDAGIYNKFANRRFLKFSLASSLNATIHAAYTSTGSDAPGGSTVTPDPDLVLYKAGEIARAESSNANVEDLVRTLDAGDYVIEVYEYSHIETPSSGTSRGRTCYNVTITG